MVFWFNCCLSQTTEICKKLIGAISPIALSCRRQNGLLFRNAKFDRLAHTIIEIRRGARERAVCQLCYAAIQEHILSAEGILPVRHPAAAQRVGNEADPAREQPERHAHGTWVDVLPVADQLRDDVFTFASRADGTGLAVVDARHGVIQVRQVGRTRVKDRGGFFVGAVGMRDGDGAEA